MVTRTEGYELARGKEDPALTIVRDCIQQVIGLKAHLIQDPERNRKRGDLELVGTAECKGQPIDPDRYPRNFVEVFEDVTALGRDHHLDGLARTAEILDLRIDELARARYLDYRHPQTPTSVLGELSHVSASLESIAGSDLTIYANPDPERTFVYFYTRQFLLDAIRDAVLAGGLRRGMGHSNDDTFGVLVAVSPARWRRIDDAWQFVGEGRPPISRIRQALSGAGAIG